MSVRIASMVTHDFQAVSDAMTLLIIISAIVLTAFHVCCLCGAMTIVL